MRRTARGKAPCGSLPGTEGVADGTGVSASFSRPCGIRSDGTNLYAADTWNGSVGMVSIPSIVVSASCAGLGHPFDPATDGAHLYVAGFVQSPHPATSVTLDR
jgi:hypothetical protein